MFVLFNKEGTFIGYSPDIPENTELLKKEIPNSQSDITMWRWDGDYQTGRMIPLDIGYPVEEMELERELFEYIDKKYPLAVQMRNIIKQIKMLVKNNLNLQDDDFMDMSDYIINAVDKHDKRVKYYRNYASLIPKDESERQFNTVFGKQS